VLGSVIFWTCGVCAWCDESHTHTHTTGPKNHAAKHQLRTQNITSNFSQARSTLPEDGS